MNNLQVSRKKYCHIQMPVIAFSIITVLFLMVLASCDEPDPDDLLPTIQNIITEDTTGLMGDLNIEVLYYLNKFSGSDIHDAPRGTVVELYLSSEDWEKYYDPMYRIMVTDKNVVYMGYLPKGEYFIYAHVKMSGTEYDVAAPILIRQRHEEITVTMKRVEPPAK